MGEMAGECERPERARQRVGRHRETDEQANVACGAVRTASQAIVTVLIPSPSEEIPRPQSSRRTGRSASSAL
jgi:hypothetical protein